MHSGVVIERADHGLLSSRPLFEIYILHIGPNTGAAHYIEFIIFISVLFLCAFVFDVDAFQAKIYQ